MPIYVGGQEKCMYNFVWKTALACSMKDLHEKSLREKNSMCTVKNPVTNHVFNLTSLIKKEFKAKLFGTTEVVNFSVCTPLNQSNCKAEAG